MENKGIKIEHFQNLIAVAMADGILEPAELDFLQDRAIELGLDEEEVKNMLANAENLHFLVPLNNVDSEDQLADIVYMMMIDGDISDKEYSLCLNIAERLELQQKDLDYVIRLTKELWEKSK